MTLKRILAAVAVAWAIVNLAGLGFAVAASEGMHASLHGVLALVFGVGAVWLWRDPNANKRHVRVEVLEDEVSDLQKQLSDAQQGLEFAEQLLAQRDKERVPDPLRYAPRPPERTAMQREPEDDPNSQR